MIFPKKFLSREKINIKVKFLVTDENCYVTAPCRAQKIDLFSTHDTLNRKVLILNEVFHMHLNDEIIIFSKSELANEKH